MTSKIASIRASTAADAPSLARIYGWHVLNGTGTFETEPPDAAELASRRLAISAASGGSVSNVPVPLSTCHP